MTRRHLTILLGLLAGGFFVLALTSHGPVPALQVTRFPGVVQRRDTSHREATTRVPATARLPRAHERVATGHRRNDPRSSSVRVEVVPADGSGRWARRVAASPEQRLPVLLTTYHDANAPPAPGASISGRPS
jgi:hypothetical protein